MEVWPDYMPRWEVGYSSAYKNAVVRSSIPGKTTQRRVSYRNSEIVSASLVLSSTEKAIFEHFVQDLLNDGADWFLGHVFNSGVVEDGNVRFVSGAYSAAPLSTFLWKISANIEIKRA